MFALHLSALMVGVFGFMSTESYPVAQGPQGGPPAGGIQMPGFGTGFPGQFPFPQPGAGFGQGFPVIPGFPAMGNNFGIASGSISYAGSHAGTGSMSSGSSATSSSWSISFSSGQQPQPHGDTWQEPGHFDAASDAGSSSQAQSNNGVKHGERGGTNASESIGTTVDSGTSHTQEKPAQEPTPTDIGSLSQNQSNIGTHSVIGAGTGEPSLRSRTNENSTTTTEPAIQEDEYETEAYTSSDGIVARISTNEADEHWVWKD